MKKTLCLLLTMILTLGLVLPAAAVYLAVHILKKLLSLAGKRKKVKSYKPNSRYYR